MRFRSTNPVYSKINKMDSYEGVAYEQATYLGVAGKTLYYMLMVVVGAFAGIFMLANNQQALISTLAISGIGTFIAAMVAFVSPRSTKIAGTIYCLLEGVLVGIVSLLFETIVPGVVVTALLGTVMVVIVSASFFLTGIIKVNNRFLRFLSIFVISILATFLVTWILSLIFPGIFNILANPQVNIIVSLVMVFLASLYIMFDLENIRQVVEGGQPKQMEWFASFGLAFTVIWLYMEVLPLVARIFLNSDN